MPRPIRNSAKLKEVDIIKNKLKELKRLLANVAKANAELVAFLGLNSAGNLTGDVAEHLTAFALGGTLTANNEKGCDLIEPENIRIEVKSCTKKAGRSLTTGAIRDLDAKTFDFMVVVEFDESHNVLSAWKIPHSVVNKFAGKLQVSTNSKKITVKQAVKEAAGVEEITHLYK